MFILFYSLLILLRAFLFPFWIKTPFFLFTFNKHVDNCKSTIQHKIRPKKYINNLSHLSKKFTLHTKHIQTHTCTRVQAAICSYCTKSDTRTQKAGNLKSLFSHTKINPTAQILTSQINLNSLFPKPKGPILTTLFSLSC